MTKRNDFLLWPILSLFFILQWSLGLMKKNIFFSWKNRIVRQLCSTHNLRFFCFHRLIVCNVKSRRQRTNMKMNLDQIQHWDARVELPLYLILISPKVYWKWTWGLGSLPLMWLDTKTWESKWSWMVKHILIIKTKTIKGNENIPWVHLKCHLGPPSWINYSQIHFKTWFKFWLLCNFLYSVAHVRLIKNNNFFHHMLQKTSFVDQFNVLLNTNCEKIDIIWKHVSGTLTS